MNASYSVLRMRHNQQQDHFKPMMSHTSWEGKKSQTMSVKEKPG